MMTLDFRDRAAGRLPPPPPALVILQEMRANIDLEFLLHLLGLAGQLVPELTSEEVLAKMCRKKAKLAVRHTVRHGGRALCSVGGE